MRKPTNCQFLPDLKDRTSLASRGMIDLRPYETMLTSAEAIATLDALKRPETFRTIWVGANKWATYAGDETEEFRHDQESIDPHLNAAAALARKIREMAPADMSAFSITIMAGTSAKIIVAMRHVDDEGAAPLIRTEFTVGSDVRRVLQLAERISIDGLESLEKLAALDKPSKLIRQQPDRYEAMIAALGLEATWNPGQEGESTDELALVELT